MSHYRRLIGFMLGALVWIALAACERERRKPASSVREEPRVSVRAADYAIDDDALYRLLDGTEVVAVLPGSDLEGADTVHACAATEPELGRARFIALSASPDSLWAAWETAGPGACVGVVGPRGPAVRVLGRWSTARPDSLLWAPSGHYLAVWLSRRDGRRSLLVYHAETGGRLGMPWDEECEGTDHCDVARANWLGGTLLDVEIRLGPAELPVPFEVNVGSAVTVERGEENRE